jgi:hypothetical protein
MADVATKSRICRSLNADQHRHVLTLRLLRELLLDSKLSETAVRVAGASIIDHAIADITGEPVEGSAAIRWAMDRARDLGYIAE